MSYKIDGISKEINNKIDELKDLLSKKWLVY